jgi:hypothetical protein
MKQMLKDWLTARNGDDFSLTKLIIIATVATMLYGFIKTGSVDYQGLAIGITALCAALVAKYHVEEK